MRKGMTLAGVLALALPAVSTAYLQFGAAQLVQDGGQPVEVVGYSIPDLYDWDGDGLADLIVGEGGGVFVGKVRVYVNRGTAEAPLFNGFFYAQEESGGDLSYPGG